MPTAVMGWNLLHAKVTHPRATHLTLSRRLRRPQTVELMVAVEQHLLALVMVSRYWVWSIDGKALPVSPVSKDPDVSVGYASRGWMKGYKFHAVWGSAPMPAAWGLSPLNTSEKTIAQELICSLPGEGYLLADSSYDANRLYDWQRKPVTNWLSPNCHLAAVEDWGIVRTARFDCAR